MAIYKMRAERQEIATGYISILNNNSIPLTIKAENAQQAFQLAEDHLPNLASGYKWHFKIDKIEIVEVQDED
ncbi:hypothetical protein J0O85_03040 [Listeria monocytogenes]|uniref:hypothetical protein n=1 Tax=Listeria monocytogenes TaxID=1639 RepID=UPI0015A47CB2|nr:hypothetical protein [Listeria monocytogenes]NVR90587.1 hypothetical protein [Listeria monocytogenes]NVS23099.1 hypothetical protein [Listeria monocytogenes]HBI2198554.1 hypothetical protein [Listeria monocytogenes]HBL6194256.1 hypothetical protein [Listeria monocytogenes]